MTNKKKTTCNRKRRGPRGNHLLIGVLHNDDDSESRGGSIEMFEFDGKEFSVNEYYSMFG